MLRGLYPDKHLSAMADSLSRGKRQMLRKPFPAAFSGWIVPRNNKELYQTVSKSTFNPLITINMSILVLISFGQERK